MCESPARSLQSTPKKKGDAKMVAVQRELLYNNWALCGKEVVLTVNGKDFAK